MQKPIVILGAGHQGNIAASIFELSCTRKIIFLDDNRARHNVSGKFLEYSSFNPEKHLFHVALGDNKQRKKWFEHLLSNDVTFISAIHPTAFISKNVSLGKNCMVGGFAFIHTNCIIGDNCIINTGAIIEHDCEIAHNVFVGPRATCAGEVTIKENAFIGMSASILNKVIIEKGCVIAAGAVVTRSTEVESRYFGIPARKRE